jgi:DNA invertase Pin-like site-specific DNA recombinase
MRIGYARVSTTEQNLDLQRDALKRSRGERIIEESASGGKVQRSGLERVQEMLRQGDVLAVWRLDRLGRSLKHLIEVMGGLEDQGIGFHSVTESIDTTTPGGKLVFHIFGALAEFERNLIRELRSIRPKRVAERLRSAARAVCPLHRLVRRIAHPRPRREAPRRPVRINNALRSRFVRRGDYLKFHPDRPIRALHARLLKPADSSPGFVTEDDLLALSSCHFQPAAYGADADA